MFFRHTLVASGLNLAHAAVLGKRALSGEATYYGGNLAGGSCSFATYTLPSNILGTALTDSSWDDAANCGACISVTGPSGNSISVMIVDMCPGCGTNHLDLFPAAFSTLANPTIGVIDVTWNYIDCPISSALELHNKEGVSAYWFSMQVVNANKRVSSLEVSTDGGNTWHSTTRQSYNFFENSEGFGTTTVDIRVTSVDGDVVIVNGVTIKSDTSVTASSNFGSSLMSDSYSASSSSTPVAILTFPPPTSTADQSSPAVATTSLPSANLEAVPTSIPMTTSLPLPQVSPTASSIPKYTEPSTSTVASTVVYVTVDACEA